MVKKKLLIVGSNGANLYNFINLVKAYTDEILFITSWLNEKFDYGNVNLFVVSFSLRNPFKTILNIFKIRRQVKKFNPDIIHIHQINSIAFLTILAARKFNIPIICTAWGSDVLLLPKTGFILKKMVTYCINQADYFTSGSNYLAFEMQQLCKNKTLNITYCNYGVNVVTDDFTREKIIFSNRMLRKLYRIDLIIKAFHNFQKDRISENWKLVIGGDGDERPNLEKLVEELGLKEQVIFTGWLNKEQNSGFYNKSIFYISLPKSDGSPVSVLEAMACGCVPILSNLPANNELVIDNFNGIIANDFKENFIQRGLSIDHKAATGFNRVYAGKKGDKEINRKKYFGLYDMIIAGKSR